MSSPQPYTENPNDVFNPVQNQTDWLELITSDSSPSESSFTNEAQEASLVGYIPWNKQRSAIAYFLGYASTNSNGSLHRANPEAHPLFPWLYCSSVALKAFNPTINLNNPNAPLQFVSPWYQQGNDTVTLSIANHKLAICNLRFHSLRYAILDDTTITDPRMEWMRNVFLDLEPKVEVLSADGISQLIFAETGVGGGANNGPPLDLSASPPVKTPFPAPVGQLLGKATYTLNWLNIPFNFLSSVDDFFYPSNILACLGCVNSQPFPYGSSTPFPAGTLLFDNVRFSQKVFPVAPADPSAPLVSVDVSITLQYFNPPKGNTSSSYVGHNLMPWRGGHNDPTGGTFFYATRGGGTADPPLLQSTDFNNIFLRAT